jgi:hypothetical protein
MERYGTIAVQWEKAYLPYSRTWGKRNNRRRADNESKY